MRKIAVFIVLLLTSFSCSFYNNPFASHSFREIDSVKDPTSDIIPPEISVSSLKFKFDGVLLNDLLEKELTISNTGKSPLEWAISELPDWLAAAPLSGVVNDESQSVKLTASAGNSEIGEFTGFFLIKSNAETNSNLEVNVSMIVIDGSNPFIRIEPDVFDFGVVTDNEITKEITITNAGGGVLNWNFETLPDWVSADKLLGSLESRESTVISLTVNRTGKTGVFNHDLGVVSNHTGGNIRHIVKLSMLAASSEKPFINSDTDTLDFGEIGSDSGSSDKRLVVLLRNDGGGVLNWRVDEVSLPVWLIVDGIASGIIEPGKAVILGLKAVSGIVSGVFEEDTVKIISNHGGNENSVLEINTKVKITPFADINISDKDIDFGDLLYGSSKEVTVKVGNTGGRTLNWSVKSKPEWLTVSSAGGSIPPASDADLLLNAAASDVGEKNGEVVIMSNAGGVVTESRIKVNMKVLALTAVIGLPEIIDFDGVVIDEEAEKLLSISNSGNTALEWEIGSLPGWITAGIESGTIEPGSSQEITLTAAAGSEPGSKEDKITIKSNNLGVSDSISEITAKMIVITADTPQMEISLEKLDFEAVKDGKQSKIFNIKNVGGGTLSWSLDEMSNWLSIETLTSGTLTSGQSVSVTVTAESLPAGGTAGVYNGAVKIISNHNGVDDFETLLPAQIKIYETIAPYIEISPASLNYGKILQNWSHTMALRIKNSGKDDLTWSIGSKPEWVVSITPDSGSIPSFGSINVIVEVKHNVLGVHTGNISVSSNHGGESSEKPVAVNIDVSQTPPTDGNPELYKKVESSANYKRKVLFTLPAEHADTATRIRVWYYTDSTGNNYYANFNGRGTTRFPVSHNVIAYFDDPYGSYKKGSYYLNRDQKLVDGGTFITLYIWKITYEVNGVVTEILSKDAVYQP